MALSSPALNSPNLRRNKRFSGVTFASVNKEATSVGARLTEGEGNLPKVVLTSAQGRGEAEIYLFGGCITSWKIPSGRDLLFVRPDAVFNKRSQSVEAFPIVSLSLDLAQYSSMALQGIWIGPSLILKMLEGNPVVTLELKDGPYSLSMWDFGFHATYKASITGASVRGLKGCKTLNKDPDPKNPIEGVEERDVVTFPGFVECIYLDTPYELHLDNVFGDVISITNTNWSDAVLWNPHLQMEASYRDFVCVENAKIGTVQLDPEKTWIAKQLLSVS